MTAILVYLLARLQEPSTYAGLGALATALGLTLSGADISGIVSLAIAGAGLAAVLVKEHGGTPQPPA
jgi:hypothetical protein